MLRLLLMRHAKSVSPIDSIEDHERLLTDSGRQSVPTIANAVSNLGWRPELIYVSDAKRTLETSELFAPVFQPIPLIEETRVLYQASPQKIADFVRNKDPAVQTLQIIGHNPTMETLLEHLSGEYKTFHPASIALLTHASSSWKEAFKNQGDWKLIQFLSAT